MKCLYLLVLCAFFSGCLSGPSLTNSTKDQKVTEMICGDCKKDDYKHYISCKRVCDLCDVSCCKPGSDRCCCLHRRDDCFKVCIAKRKKKISVK